MPLTAFTCLAAYCYYLNQPQYALVFALAAFLIVFTNASDDARGRTGWLDLLAVVIYATPVAYLMTIV